MTIGHKIKEFMRKFRLDCKQKVNWPELSKYCGILSLSTGICLKSTISLLTVTAQAVLNGLHLCKIFYARDSLDGIRVTVESDHKNQTISDEDLRLIADVLHSLTIYYIIWIVLKILYILSVFIIYYAIIAKHRFLLKCSYWIMVVNWMFNILMLVSTRVLLNAGSGIVFHIIDILVEGYNLLAINSLYKQISCKSRIVPKEAYSTASAITPTSINSASFEQAALCPICAGMRAAQNENRSDRIQNELNNEPHNSDSPDNSGTEEKPVNFKDGPIIFNQEQLQGATNGLFSPRDNGDLHVVVKQPPAVRPTTLDLTSSLNAQ